MDEMGMEATPEQRMIDYVLEHPVTFVRILILGGMSLDQAHKTLTTLTEAGAK